MSTYWLRTQIRIHFQGAKGSHDWEHTERVLALALHLGKIEHADLEILEYAALLHDIARHEEDQSQGKIDHAWQGAIMAREILLQKNLPPDTIAAIAHCIETHRFRNQRMPQSLEAKILFDADKLDAIGAVGIGRAFLFAGEVGAKLHNPEADWSRTLPYSEEDTAFREFQIKLRHIQDRMLTPEGSRLARERHQFMVAFFDRLNQETQGIF